MGGDSDDDWDDDEDDEEAAANLAKELKAKERRAKNKALGLDSDYESDEEPEAPAPDPNAPKKPAPPKAKTRKDLKEEVVEEERELDPEAEKLRQRKLEEEQNERAAMDLFGSCSNAFADQKKEKEKKEAADKAKKAAAAKPKIVIVDTFDSVTLNVQADVSSLSKTCCEKLQKGTCKGAPQKFLIDLLKQLEENLATKELADLEKILEDSVKEKKKPQGATVVKQNKATTKLSKTTKFNQGSEWEDVYGGGGGGEDWTQEEWDDWEKEEKKKAEAAAQAKP